LGIDLNFFLIAILVAALLAAAGISLPLILLAALAFLVALLILLAALGRGLAWNILRLV
jgi:hypothetical protein